MKKDKLSKTFAQKNEIESFLSHKWKFDILQNTNCFLCSLKLMAKYNIIVFVLKKLFWCFVPDMLKGCNENGGGDAQQHCVQKEKREEKERGKRRREEE